MKNIKRIIILSMILMLVLSVQTLAATGQQLVDYAKQYLGYPYGWGAAGEGGCSAIHKGTHYFNNKDYDKCFDCSGFVWYVYTKCGVNVGGRCVAADFAYKGVNVPNNASLQPGDILVFRNGKHVGIYIGNNQYIHASGKEDVSHWQGAKYNKDGSLSSSGTGYVKINDLSWDKNITSRRRIITNGTFDPSITPDVPEYSLPEITPNFELVVTDTRGIADCKWVSDNEKRFSNKNMGKRSSKYRIGRQIKCKRTRY